MKVENTSQSLVKANPTAQASDTPSIPDLIKALSDEDKDVRAEAAVALAIIGPEAKDAVPELRIALSDPEIDVRAEAAFALGEIGPAAQTAIETLRKLADEDLDRDTRRVATEALAKIEV